MKAKDKRIKDLLDSGKYDVTEEGAVISNQYRGNKNRSEPLKPCTGKDGYERVVLSDDIGAMSCCVHRVVAIKYLENADNLPEINHIDGSRSNNHLSNIEWVTRKENVRHSISDEPHWSAKIDAKIAKKVKEMIADERGSTYIAKKLGITRSIVESIRRGVTWKGV